LLIAFISSNTRARIDLSPLAGGVGSSEAFTLFNLFGARFDIFTLILQRIKYDDELELRFRGWISSCMMITYFETITFSETFDEFSQETLAALGHFQESLTKCKYNIEISEVTTTLIFKLCLLSWQSS
jgi:hypothetical protein